MNEFKVIKIKKAVLENNNKIADEIRSEIKNTFFINLMSSQGSGKTTLLSKTIQMLGKAERIAVIEADIDGEVDAAAINNVGARTIQMHTGGMCHVDARMAKEAIAEMGVEDLDLLILENVGNLICTASYDVGGHKNVTILSVPEGDDKPIKYPKMYQVCDIILVSKMDTVSVFDFSLERLENNIKKLNPNAVIIPLSAKTGEGMQPWIDYINSEIAKRK